MPRKGIILAGGTGTRLHPLTIVTSKQLLPVYDKPMIYYPLTTLMWADVREILIITTAEDQAAFKRLLGEGSHWGIKLEYAIQHEPGGLAQAYLIGEEFLAGSPSCLVLGDNILFGQGLPKLLLETSANEKGAVLFGYKVSDPERYGVIEFDANERVLSLEEKPQKPRSHWAAIGLYFYDPRVTELVRELRPSARGELEITDLNRLYLRQSNLRMRRLGRGYAWFDAGTHASLMQAAEFVGVLQSRQGQLIAAPEEVAFQKGWIDAGQLRDLARDLAKSSYGAQLLDVLAADPMGAQRSPPY
jgi:glucose-1-phosphate thymidylyltransferase